MFYVVLDISKTMPLDTSKSIEMIELKQIDNELSPVSDCRVYRFQ